MNISNKIDKFIKFINSNWEILDDYCDKDLCVEYEDIKGLWLQLHWELIVDFKLNQEKFLQVYYSGAEVYNDSDRVIYPHRKGFLYKILCVSENKIDLLSGKEIKSLIEYDFVKFVNFDKGCYSECTPFNAIQLEDINGDFVIVTIDDVNFEAVATQND